LLAAVVGSGIMAERLAGGSGAIALLANAIATGCALAALSIAFQQYSGAHFNPVVTCALAFAGRHPWRQVAPYALAQLMGAVLGVLTAHAMFDLPLWQVSEKARTSVGQWLSEVVATGGLVFIVLSGVRAKSRWLPFSVAAYITAAYWFTASTSFANPAVTIARAMTNTFAGISPSHVLPFVAAQALGAAGAYLLERFLCAAAPPP
jgi:glycerol uptake facilitator-like aquaporin